TPEHGRRVRAAWGLVGEPLIGLVGRVEATKDYPTFLKAAARLSAARPDVRFVCVGEGSAAHAAELRALAQSLHVEGSVIWAGIRHDMPAVYNALDVLTSASVGESFSNVIAEAMACGVPCVVTHVGNSPSIVGETGLIVAPGDPDALAAQWQLLLDL